MEKKISLTLGKPGQTSPSGTNLQLQTGAPAPIDARSSGSLLSSVWKMLALIGIALIIWLLLQRR